MSYVLPTPSSPDAMMVVTQHAVDFAQTGASQALLQRESPGDREGTVYMMWFREATTTDSTVLSLIRRIDSSMTREERLDLAWAAGGMLVLWNGDCVIPHFSGGQTLIHYLLGEVKRRMRDESDYLTLIGIHYLVILESLAGWRNVRGMVLLDSYPWEDLISLLPDPSDLLLNTIYFVAKSPKFSLDLPTLSLQP